MFLEFANHLWQSTLFAAAIAVLCYLLRHDRAAIRYGLWWIASIKFLVPFSLLTAIGARLAGNSMGFVPDIWPTTAEIVAKPFAAGVTWSPGAALFGLWAAGSIALLTRWLVGATRLRAIVSHGTPDSAPLTDDERPIRVIRSDARVEPGIVGIFRPVLLLPAGIETRLTSAQFKAVLTHEVCHIQRRDNLTAAIHMLIEIIFWFHPLVWWIGAKLIDERERACDEMVVAMGHDRETYAEGILDVCELYAASPLRCAAGISGSDLKRRIKQIMRYQDMKSLKLAKKFLLSVAALFALAVPLLAGLAVQEVALAQENATPSAAPGGSVEEYLPIVHVAPIYPVRALERGLEGYVIVQYTVNPNGSTENVTVIESSSTLFDESAIESAKKYKYKPRVVNGTPVAVEGVTSKLVFELAADANPGAAGE
jgi:TonB family protein